MSAALFWSWTRRRDTNTAAETFVRYDRAETRDPPKALIALISVTLALLAFVDKIVGNTDFQPLVRHLMFGAWTLFLSALALAGVGMVLIAAAAGCVLRGGIPDLKQCPADLERVVVQEG